MAHGGGNLATNDRGWRWPWEQEEAMGVAAPARGTAGAATATERAGAVAAFQAGVK